jgi:hypothetical protein
VLASVLAIGCARPPLLDRAVRARGGMSRAIAIHSEAQVYVGVPGTWELRRIFLAPDCFAWRITTAADPIFQTFDGHIARSFVGTAEISRAAAPDAELRSHARWTAVTNLDGLAGPGVAVTELPSPELPTDVREGLLVRLPDGTQYRLGFDGRALLVWARGPLDLSPLAHGEVTARFSDHRRSGRFTVPFRTTYSLGSTPLADERLLAVCVDPPNLTPAAFADPTLLPECR